MKKLIELVDLRSATEKKELKEIPLGTYFTGKMLHDSAEETLLVKVTPEIVFSLESGIYWKIEELKNSIVFNYRSCKIKIQIV